MFQNVTGKLGNMKKAVEWTISPRNVEDKVCIQCDRRIARVDLITGRAMLSDGKGGHPGFHKLSPAFGAVEVEVPAAMLTELKTKLSPVGAAISLS